MDAPTKEKLFNSLNSLAKVAETAIKLHIESNKPKPFWRNKFFWSLILAATGLLGYELNWEAQLRQLTSARIEKLLQVKQERLYLINQAISNIRVIIVNQLLDCKARKHPNLYEMRKERMKSLAALMAAGSGTRFLYQNNQIQDKVIAIVSRVDQIKDICSESPDIDETLHGFYSQLNILVGQSIGKDEEKLHDLEESNLIF